MSASSQRMDVADKKAKTIKAICHFIMNSEEIQADSTKVAASLGVVRARNIPEKINSIINPHGFEYEAGKMTLRRESAGPEHPRTDADAGDDDVAAVSMNTPTRKRTNPSTPEAQITPEIPKTPGAPKSPNTPPSKRHKRISRNPFFTEEEIRIARKGKARAMPEEEDEDEDEDDSDVDMDRED